MTYAAFLGFFLLPPIAAAYWLGRKRWGEVHPAAGRFLAAMAAIALCYTTPWDNYLVWRGIWSYGEDRVLGTIGWVPVEEYAFFILQPFLSGLWFYAVLSRAHVTPAPNGARWTGGALFGLLTLCGAVLLAGPAEGTYLGLILVWAGPVLALQWLYAGRQIWSHRRAWVFGVGLPTLYLWSADALAIHLGIWRISEAHTLGPAIGPLPLEEAVFFLVTNLLVIQGLILFVRPPSAAPTRQGHQPRERDTEPQHRCTEPRSRVDRHRSRDITDPNRGAGPVPR